MELGEPIDPVGIGDARVVEEETHPGRVPQFLDDTEERALAAPRPPRITTVSGRSAS